MHAQKFFLTVVVDVDRAVVYTNINILRCLLGCLFWIFLEPQLRAPQGYLYMPNTKSRNVVILYTTLRTKNCLG